MPTSLLDLVHGTNLEAALTGSAVACLVLLLVGSTMVLRKQQSSQNQWHQELQAARRKDQEAKKHNNTTAKDASSPIPPSAAPVDVWADRMAKGVAPASLNRKSGAGQDKPFGSSYYYAHNNSKTTGGYKDGLRMEDYTMNGPRLLSRNGSAVSMQPQDEDATMESTETPPAESTTAGEKERSLPVVREPPQRPVRTIVPISKYLWDDAPTLGTIRIDQLPQVTGTAMVAWKDVDVVNHTSGLRDKGLLVTVTTRGDIDYRLHIRALFAGVVEVKTCVTKGNKRLLVKLTKTKRQDWPHPQAKVI